MGRARGSAPVTSVIWDWNGTLLDDTQAALDTLNAMLAKRGGRRIAMDFYRDHFAFPVKPFYEAIGVRLGNEDWDALAREYHDIYAEQAKGLNAETFVALEYAKGKGARQAIVSALRQDLLSAITEELGVARYMDFIYGVDNLDGRSKVERAHELVAAMGVASQDAVLIGDSLHDKEVADAIGVRCVLCAQGSHAAWRLREVAPTGETLMEAVRMALG